MRVFGIETRYAHLDSIRFGLHGAYAVDDQPDETTEDEPIPITITYGYSRDHRPDLKQAVLSLICAMPAV